jgi:hypothetical protein
MASARHAAARKPVGAVGVMAVAQLLVLPISMGTPLGSKRRVSVMGRAMWGFQVG